MPFVQLDGYPVDLAKVETYSFENEATDEPVESGADVTDHIKANPTIITLEVIVSDTPSGAIASDPTRKNAAGETLPGQDAYQRILKLRDDRKTFTLIASRGTFLNMSIASFVESRTSSTAKSFHATITLKQLRFVTNNRTTVRVAVPSTGKPQNLGNNASQQWSAITGIKNVIFVVSVRNSADVGSPSFSGDKARNANAVKMWGPAVFSYQVNSTPINAYQVDSTTTPDGYVDLARTKYTPLALTPVQSAQGAGAAAASQKPIPPRPNNTCHYNYGRQQWEDGSGKPVTQNTTPGSPPADNNAWNSMTKPGLPAGTP